MRRTPVPAPLGLEADAIGATLGIVAQTPVKGRDSCTLAEDIYIIIKKNYLLTRTTKTANRKFLFNQIKFV